MFILLLMRDKESTLPFSKWPFRSIMSRKYQESSARTEKTEESYMNVIVMISIK